MGGLLHDISHGAHISMMTISGGKQFYEIGINMNDVGCSGRLQQAWVYNTGYTKEIMIQRVRFYTVVAREQWCMFQRRHR